MVQNILKPMSSHSYGTAMTDSLQVSPGAATSDPAADVSTTAAVAASGTTVVVLAAKLGRKGATFYNGGSTTCTLTLGATATTSNYVTSITSGSSYSLPAPVYNGVVSAIWSGSPTGNMQVTSF